MTRRLMFGILAVLMLLGGVVTLINVQAQAPQKAQIAFQASLDGGKYEVYVMDADGKNQRNLTNHPAWDWDPVWSSDGQRIAFGTYRDENWEVYVMDADGKNQRNLTNHLTPDWGASWSPDGQRIAFTSKRDGNYEIYVMDADGKNQRNLTNNPADDARPDWFDPASVYAVSPAGKLRATWGWIKRISE